ncbi:MAG: two-component sensor histidine kinase [Pseudonocardiales bacterium]|nr:two-component sensor histidine kinase [Pseudonocardiales bacterium]
MTGARLGTRSLRESSLRRTTFRTSSLATRIALLAISAAAITAIVAGVLSVGLARSASERQARDTLARVADAAVASSEAGGTVASQTRARRTLQAVQVQFAIIGPTGRITSNDPLARAALRPDDIARVLAGSAVSARRTVSGSTVFIEARRTRDGGLVVVQRRSDALAGVDEAIKRVLLALSIGVVIAGGLGLLVAYRIARPLRRTAAAAQALALGHRDVAVDPQGPAEVAEVGLAVNRLAEALSHSEGRQREFLLSVSHDLRTPLTAITGYAESLADGVVPPDQLAEVGAVMLRESRRLDRLVSDLLDLARLDAKEFRIDLSDADVTALAADAAIVWNQRCSAGGVHFRLEVPTEPIWLVTDAGRLRQILDGLLENSLRVTPSGSVMVLAVRIETASAVRPSVVVEVRDGGPGLRDEDLAVAFDRSVLHERYRAVRQVGTGFGLAIVRGLVGRLGGDIEAGHAFEGGARFTVRLPVQPPG